MDKVIQLQDREGNNLYPISADGITKSRSVLISGVKGYENKSWSSATASIVNSNDFTKYIQFGPQAKDSGVASTIKVTVPEGETWTIKVTLGVQATDIRAGLLTHYTAIAELPTDGSTTGAKWIASSQVCHQYGLGSTTIAYRTLTAGTYYYAASGYTQNGSATTWYGQTSTDDRTTTPVVGDGTVGPSYTLTAELLEKSGEELNTTIKPTPAYNIGLGTVLAWAREVGNYTVPSGNATLWTTGTWTQYGPMKNNENPWCISITAPAGEDWWVELSAVAGKIHAGASNSATGIGIAEVTDTTIDHRLALSFGYFSGSASNFWYCTDTRALVKIPAGTSKTFALYTKKETSSATIKGTGPDDTTTDMTLTGDAVNFKATLVDKASA